MAKSNREVVLLACEECGRRNYTTTRNKKVSKTKLSLNKYCRFDRKHTTHKETK